MTQAVTTSKGVRTDFADAGRIQVGDSVCLRATITEKDVQSFADLSGDYNPLHMDSGFARTTSFQRRVVHGMILASYVSRLVGMHLPGAGALWTQQSFRWLAPVFIDDTVEVSLTVKHKSHASNLLTIEVKAVKQDGAPVMEGEGTTMLVETRQEQKDEALAQRIALVTGGSRGIGAAIALELGRAGASVAVLYRNHRTEAEEVCGELGAAGGRGIAVEADVLDAAAVAAAGARIREEFGYPVDILVNCAGGRVEPRAFLESTWQDLQKQLDVHVRGAFHCCQAVIPGMLEQGSGRIVNIGSVLGWNVPPPNWTGFIMSKAALKSMTRSLATEFGPKGIRVNMVSPGLTETDSIADMPERMRKLQAMQAPLRRLSSPRDIARAVAFLCFEGGASITGADIPVCAGANM
jgi:3-oxoacyl-[acyl-carrier protein] reductase